MLIIVLFSFFSWSFIFKKLCAILKPGKQRVLILVFFVIWEKKSKSGRSSECDKQSGRRHKTESELILPRVLVWPQPWVIIEDCVIVYLNFVSINMWFLFGIYCFVWILVTEHHPITSRTVCTQHNRLGGMRKWYLVYIIIILR